MAARKEKTYTVSRDGQMYTATQFVNSRGYTQVNITNNLRTVAIMAVPTPDGVVKALKESGFTRRRES